MVEYNENEVTITVGTPDPHGFVHALQVGIINMVQSLLSVSGINEGLVLDAETKDGCRNALEAVKATLPDPEVLGTIQEIATQIMPPHEPPED